MSEKWYVATLIVQALVGEDAKAPYLCDEQVRLICAENSQTAYEKALKLGADEEHSYLNDDGKTVSWKFLGLEDLQELDTEKIEDGIEIRNRLFEHHSPQQIVRSQENLADSEDDKQHYLYS